MARAHRFGYKLADDHSGARAGGGECRTHACTHTRIRTPGRGRRQGARAGIVCATFAAVPFPARARRRVEEARSEATAESQDRAAAPRPAARHAGAAAAIWFFWQ